MPSNTGFDICSDALVLCGIPPIASFTEGTTPSTVAGQLYERNVQNNLSLHRWRFSTTQAELQRAADAPKGRWSAIYTPPADVLAINALTLQDCPVPYDRYDDGIYCDLGPDDRPILDYAYRAAESVWPPYFVTLVTFDLASYFAGAIARNGPLADTWRRKWSDQMVFAKTADSQQQTTRRLQPTRLTSRR
jgi:hypothetical protein